MAKSTKQSKVVAVPVDQPDNANAVDVDPVASDYTQVKGQAEKSVENPIEPVQTVVVAGADPLANSKPKARANSKAKAEVDTTQLDKGIVMDEKPVEAAVYKAESTSVEPAVDPVKQAPVAEPVSRRSKG